MWCRRAHTDFGVITLLLTDGLPGLQVQNQNTGQWVSVPPDENAFVVNVGDMLQQITGGYFKSNLHRVLNLGDADRHSVPYFFGSRQRTVQRKRVELDDGLGQRRLTCTSNTLVCLILVSGT